MAETGESGNGITDEKGIRFREKAPRVIDMVRDTDRNNQLRSIEVNPVTFKRSERAVFTEKEGLEDLVSFLDLTLQTAEIEGDAVMVEKVRLFKENVVFVGEKELTEATQAIARHLVDVAREGKDVFIYVAGTRSERYIALRILEEIDCLTEELVDLRKRIRISESPKAIARSCKDALGHCLVVVTDDFVVSGTRIQGFVSRAYSALLDEGFTQEEAATLIEADVIAAPDRRGGSGLSIGSGERTANLKTYLYYSIPEYRDSKDKWVVFTGISISGSHSSTDYGFEMVLEDFWKYLLQNGVERGLPLLLRVVRPYEMEKGFKYKDPVLQTRWEKIQEKYGMTS